MSSVIASARTSSASLFDFIGVTATTLTSTVTVASRAIEMLDHKTRVYHEGVLLECTAVRTTQKLDIISTQALAFTERQEALHKRLNKDEPFNFEQAYSRAVELITTALQEKD